MKNSNSQAGIIFNIGEKYEALKFLGVRSNRILIKAKDKEANKFVTIEKFGNIEDISGAKRVLRELKILRFLNHENISNLNDIIFRKGENLRELYLVTDFLEADLAQVIESHENLDDLQIRFIVYQIIRALMYLHSGGVIHRDLKPANILVDQACNIKISDFSLSRVIGHSSNECLTEYVMTRYYRAPEVMLSDEYSIAVDMWSLGCIMAELINGEILFKGENYINQIKLIFSLLGKPENTSFITNQSAKKFIDKLSTHATKPLISKIKTDNLEAIDLLQRLLQIDPNKRITAAEAISHPYLKNFREEESEILLKKSIDLRFESDMDLGLSDIYSMILEEVNHFRKLSGKKSIDKNCSKEKLSI